MKFDPFRSTYRKLTAEEAALIDVFKTKATDLAAINATCGEYSNGVGMHRLHALAFTHLELAVMYFTKAVSTTPDPQEQAN